MRVRALCVGLVVLLTMRPAEPSGVVAVAGPNGFNPSVVGRPIKWANASLTYYTDLGDLSPALTQDAANAFVADAFARWTSVPSASLSVMRGGALAQDVNGTNVFVSGGELSMPADVLPTATHRPLGVIYDSDGQVIDALLGAGAGSATFCETHAVVGGADAYTADGHFAHALLVLNGNCAEQSSDLATLKYRLIRMAGRVLGVGWTLLNDNVRSGTPPPTAEELAGFPLMHPRGPNCQGPITVLARSGSRLLVQAPSLGNGAANLVVTDLATGDASTITGGMRYGTISGDLVQVVSSANPTVPVGSETPNPIRLRVTEADGVTPIAGVMVTLSAAPAPSFFPVCGTNPCAVATDAQGEVVARLAVRAEGENTVTASIGNGAQAAASISGGLSSLSIHASRPTLRVPLGAALSLPLSVRVLANGSPVSGQAVNFSFGTNPSSGTATLAAPSVLTNAQGDAVNQVNVSALGSSFVLLICVSGGSPCTTVNINAVAAISQQLHVLQGGTQLLISGQSAGPIILRVTDGGDSARPVRGAAVTVATSVFAPRRETDCDLQNTDCHPASARPIATAFTTLVSDDNGLVAFTPAIQPSWGAVNVYARFSVGAGAGQAAQTSIQVFK